MADQFNLKAIGKARKLDNFKVIDNDFVNNNECLVLFSSNALYFPNTDENLQRLIDSNKFEWENLTPRNYARVIYVRDVYKQWYVNGISDDICSIEKLADFLNGLIKGYNTRFVGSSAGGYAAVLFGHLCGANVVLSISGQFDLSVSQNKKNPLIHTLKKEYINIIRFANKSNCFYVCPIRSEQDKIQFDKVHENINVIMINSGIHGVPIYSFSIRKLIGLECRVLSDLSSGKIHNRFLLSLRLIDFKDLLYKLKKVVRVRKKL